MSGRDIRRGTRAALLAWYVCGAAAPQAAEQMRFQEEPLRDVIASASEWFGVSWKLVAPPDLQALEVSATISRVDADSALASILRGLNYYVVVDASSERIHLLDSAKGSTFAPRPAARAIRPAASRRKSSDPASYNNAESIPDLGSGPYVVTTREDGVVEVDGPRIVADDGSVWEYGAEADGGIGLVRVSGPEASADVQATSR